MHVLPALAGYASKGEAATQHTTRLLLNKNADVNTAEVKRQQAGI
jgi:hypothetical protein